MSLENYSPTNWQTGMPITANNMNKIEAALDATVDEVRTMSGNLATAQSNIGTITGTIGDRPNGYIKTIWQTIVDLNDTFTQSTIDSTNGTKAWAQIIPLIQLSGDQVITTLSDTVARKDQLGKKNNGDDVFDANNTVASAIDSIKAMLGYTTVDNNLVDYFNNVNTVSRSIINLYAALGTKTVNNEVIDAFGTNNTVYDAIVQLTNDIGTVDGKIDAAKTSSFSSLKSRLDAIAQQAAEGHDALQEIENAHRIRYDVNEIEIPDTLVERFTDNETAINGKVNVSDVVNNLNTPDSTENKVLDARQGRAIKDLLYKTGDTVFTTTDTVAARIKGVADRVTALEGDTSLGTLDSRVDDIEDILEGSLVSSVIRTPGANQGDPDTDTTYQTLDARLEAIESHAAAVRTDVNSIANELAMVDNNAIVTTNTRVDTLENDLRTMATELNMLDGTSIVDTNSRIDTLETAIDGRLDDVEYAISHAATQEDNTTGLTQRIAALETEMSGGRDTYNDIDARFDAVEAVANAAAVASTVNSALEGLDSRLDALDTAGTGAIAQLQAADTALDARLDAIDGGNALTGSTLVSRVTTLEQEPKSATEIVAALPQEGDEDKDYLVGPDADGNYFYYKWISDEWKLISGGGSGSSGLVMLEDDYDDLENKAQNTDYYVIETDGIHHYRWIPGDIEGQTEEIEIGKIIDTNKIKRYRFARHTRNDNGEEKVYLDVYEFGYNVLTPDINDENHAENRIAAIELPKGGGEVSGDTVCIVSYVTPQNQIITQEIANTEGVKLSFFYQSYENSGGELIEQSGTYTLKKGSRIIDSGTINSAPVQTDNESNPITPSTSYKQQNAHTIDVTKYCTANDPADFVLQVTSASGIIRTRPYHVEVVELGLRSSFNSQTIFNANTNLRIPLVINSPERNKTIYIVIDKDTADEYEITQVHGEKASSNTTVTIPADRLDPGLHSISIHFEEIITGDEPASSNELLFDIACRDTENDTNILLSSPYRGKTIELDQYQTLKIPYYLYIPEGMSVNVVKINGANNKTTVEEGATGAGEFLFKASQASTLSNDELVPYTLTIGCQAEGESTLNPTVVVQVKVTPNEYNIEPVTDGLVFDFNPTGYINNPQNEEDKFWRDENNSSIRLSEVPGENFDWDNGGWKYDEETEAPYFCVKAGSRAQINYSLFQDNMETNGSEFKCIFKATNVRDPEAVFITSLDEDTSTVTNYSSDYTADNQDPADEDTLLSNFFNVKEGHVLTYKKGAVDADKLAITVLDATTIVLPDGESGSPDTSYIMTSADFTSALNKAKNKVIKKNTTDYITKIVGYVTAYDGADAADLAVLVNSDSLDTKAEAQTVSDTLKNSATWETFRETSTYANIMVDLPTLIKNYDLTYDTQVIVTDKFASMVITDDHIDEYEKKIVKNIHAVKSNGDAVDSQVEISYDLDDNQQPIYSTVYLAREILSQTERSTGLEMRAHRANIHLGSGTLTYPYSEDDIIEFEYNISNPLTRKKTAPILMYEDGVPSASMLYSTGSNALVQSTKGNLIIGSDDCDIWIYRMKFYNKKLENIEILSNFYADALNPEDMISRYEKNIATYTDNSDPDSITPQSIAAACPDLRVIMIEAPNLTGGKNSFIKNTKIRCIYKGEDARPEDNWVALNAYHAGQGTSSDAYGAAGRNLDIIFGFDGVNQLIAPKAKNNYRFDPTYKSILITGVDDTDNDIGDADDYINEILNNLNDNKVQGSEDYTEREDLLEEDDFTDGHLHMYLNGTGKVNFNNNAIPNAWFNIKLNIASSENTNNALLQKRYDRYLPYTSPAKARDARIKNDMEFFNTVVFIKETGDPTEFTKPGEKNQWHFYGIGNIGDSKKTDDTRVNIPGDPNEFCVEVSDNGLTNSGFSSGVYWTDDTQTEITYNPVGSYAMKYPISNAEWINENNLAHAAITDYEEDGGWDQSCEFRYDISTKDGNTIADSAAEKALATARQEHNKEVYANMYKWVVTAPTSGDDSFANHLRDWFVEESPLYWYLFTERYTMIDSRAKNTFWHYGKVYVSAEEIDGDTAAECTRVIARQAALTAALAGTDEVAIAEAQTAYDTAVFVWEHKDCFILEGDRAGSYANAAHINDGYRFDLWDYDNDTALGINNNGQMVFDAGLEDIDRTANAWVYNEATSVFWRRIRNEMYTQLRSVYTSRRENCFNAENLIKEFDTWQEQFPENLWRMDFERKYYRPYAEGNNMRYLRDMANGRKKYQRREFERNMCIYIDSKYVLTDAYNSKDVIQFRPTQQQNTNQDKQVKITLYSPMYINFSIGNQANTPGSHVRCMAGETKSFDFFAGITDPQNIQTKIFNASRIKEITGLENYYADDIDFTAASKLRKITLGSDTAKIVDNEGNVVSTIPYRNNNTTTLALGAGNPILEELDIRNCIALAPVLDLSECISLGKLYATGTPLTQVLLATGGLMKELYLPASITSLDFNNLYLLDTVQLAGTNNLISYKSHNILRYNSKSLIYNTLANLTRLEMNDINWNIGNIDELEQFKQKQLTLGNKMSISGTVNVTGNYSEIEVSDYDLFWNHKVLINTDNGNLQIRYKITYKYDNYYDEDNNLIIGDTIDTLYIAQDATIPDIWKYWDEDTETEVSILGNKGQSMPSRASTRSYTYQFGTRTDGRYNYYSGWKYQGSSSPLNSAPTAQNNTVLETYFKTDPRKYAIKWYLKYDEDNNTYVDLIKTSNAIGYGEGYDQEAPTVQEIHNTPGLVNSTASVTVNGGIADYEIFDGWEKLPTNINPDGSSDYFIILAKWKTGRIVLNSEAFSDIHNLAPEELLVMSALTREQRNQYGLTQTQTINYTMGHDFDRTPATSTLLTDTGILRFDRSDMPRTKNITPFATNDGWTIAIDYSFMPDAVYYNSQTDSNYNAAVLAGCYKEVTGANNTKSIVGFALYENTNSQFGPIGPCLGFGDMFNQASQVVALGNSATIGERNMVVLRRPANSESLFIYSGKNGSLSLVTTITGQQKNWNKVLSDAKIELGRLSDSSLSSIVTAAKGTIYWAKYWPEDLGVGMCKQIAAWPHETITFGIANSNNTTTANNRLNPGNNIALVLTAISGSNHGTVYQPAAGKLIGDITGWSSSNARTICNSVIFNGLPERLQSIICKAPIRTKNLSIVNDGGDTATAVLTNVETTDDYIYLPSVRNYIDLSNYSQEDQMFQWSTSAGTTVYTYNTNGSTFSSATANASYKNLRFPGKPINLSNLRILNIVGQVGNLKTLVNSGTSPMSPIQEGDIVVDDGYAAYMYVSSSSIVSGGLQVEPDSGKFSTDGDGGWLKAQLHWTRSIGKDNPTNYFIYMNNEQGDATYSSPGSAGLSLNYSFSV